MKQVLKIVKLDENATIPTRNNPTDSGLDLYALNDQILKPGETQIIKTGIAFIIPAGFEIQVRPRSGLSAKTKFRVANAPGTVDQSYRGDISVIGFHAGLYGDAPVVIKKGDRIAQAVMCPVEIPDLEEVGSVDETDRGSKGFGSSGT